METLIFERTNEVRKNKRELEKKLYVAITIDGKKVAIDGEPIAEFTAEQVLSAINFGFSSKRALFILNTDIQFKKLNIKNFTHRKNLREIKARLIGTEGKTKKTIEEVADCDIVINEKDNEVGIIGPASSMDNATTAITNLIRGSKQGNVYKYLENMNREKKKYLGDLGLKIKEDKKISYNKL